MQILADVYHMTYDYKRLELVGVYKGYLNVTGVKPNQIEKECRKHWLLDYEKAVKIILTQIDDAGSKTLSEKIYPAK